MRSTCDVCETRDVATLDVANSMGEAQAMCDDCLDDACDSFAENDDGSDYAEDEDEDANFPVYQRQNDGAVDGDETGFGDPPSEGRRERIMG